MEKVYVLSKRKDAELEQAIHDMDAYHLRIALYGVARGWQFDDAFSIAEEAAQQSVQRTAEDDPQPGSLDYWAAVTSKNSGDDRRR